MLSHGSLCLHVVFARNVEIEIACITLSWSCSVYPQFCVKYLMFMQKHAHSIRCVREQIMRPQFHFQLGCGPFLFTYMKD